VGLASGFHTAIFGATAAFTLIVLFDAQGVRRDMGKQAEILNKMLDDIYWKKHIQEKRLKELLGHTPIQVYSGMFLGIMIAILLW
jgi:acid phosphatase family membrane protein YuiD